MGCKYWLQVADTKIMKIRYYVIILIVMIVVAALHGDDAAAYVYNSSDKPLYLMQISDKAVVDELVSSGSAFLHSFLDDNADSLVLLAPGGWMELDAKDSLVVGYFLDRSEFIAMPVAAETAASFGGWFSVGDEHVVSENGRAVRIPLWAINLPSAPVMPDYDFSEWKRYSPSLTANSYARVIRTVGEESEDIETEIARYGSYDFLPDNVWLFKDGLWYAGVKGVDFFKGVSVNFYAYDDADNALWLIELPFLSDEDEGRGYAVMWRDASPVPVGVFTYADNNIEARWQIDEALLLGVSRIVVAVSCTDGEGYQETFVAGSVDFYELEDTVSWH